MSVVGFDIGNETCYIAIARDGGIEVIDNDYSSRMTPSYVGFTENSRSLGVAARSKLSVNINNTVFGFKTILGKKLSNAKNDLEYLSFDVRELPSDELGIAVKYLNEDTVFSVQQVMAMMLTKLKTLAEVKLGSKVRECVISVPIFYTDVQRRAMLDAASISGLKVLKLMNEPTAIALSYGFYRQNLFDQPNTIVFVDLGQSALTVTAGVFMKDKLSILGTVWNTHVGGREFDLVLVRYFAEEFKSKYNIDVTKNKKALMTLMLECEAVKKHMSMNSRDINLNIECLMNNVDVCGKINREVFELLSAHLLLIIENTMRELLARIKLDQNGIHEVQIVGGSCRLPALKPIIFKVFGQQPHTTLNQDEAVARGCALQCAFLSPTLKTKEYIIDDIQPFTVKVSTCQKSTVSNELEVFPRFMKIPASKKITYNYKDPFYLKAFYSDQSLGITDIGKYHFSDIPSGIRGDCDVRLIAKLSIDINGIFNVTSATMQVKEISDIQDALSKQMVIVPLDENDNQSKKKHAQKDDSSEVEEDSNKEETEKENPTEITKSFVLTIRENSSSLSKLDLNRLVKKELEMINTDLHEKKMADLRNVVEEYVYHSRGKLTEDLKGFVSNEDKEKILGKLNEVEAWLYDSDSQSEDEYLQKLDELKSSFEPIWNTFQQFQNVKFAMDKFKNVLESSLANIQVVSSDKKKACDLDEGDIRSLEQLWNQKSEIFNQCVKVIDDTRFGRALPIQADAIHAEIYDFENEIRNIVNKPVAKVISEENAVIGDQSNDPGSMSDESKNSESVDGQNDRQSPDVETPSNEE